MKTICVFCGASPGTNPAYLVAAHAMGKALAANDITLIYGGSSLGIMGAVADSVLDHGGSVTGVIPRALATKEKAHHGLRDLRVVESMHERKAMMSELADGFVALPGGMGTLEELCEIITWAQLGIHTKPIGLLNVEGYFEGLITFIDHMVDQGFVPPHHRELITVRATPEGLFDGFASHKPPLIPTVLSKSQT